MGEVVMKKKVFDDYDYENFYNQSFHEQTGELLNDRVKSLRGVAYTTATIKAGNQLEVEIYPSFKKEIHLKSHKFQMNLFFMYDTDNNARSLRQNKAVLLLTRSGLPLQSPPQRSAPQQSEDAQRPADHKSTLPVPLPAMQEYKPARFPFCMRKSQLQEI